MYVHTSMIHMYIQPSAEFWKCKEGVYKHDTVSMSLLNTGEFHLFLWKPKGGVCVFQHRKGKAGMTQAPNDVHVLVQIDPQPVN